MNWAIACILPGHEHFYYGNVQFKPQGSLTLVRKGQKDILHQVMTFVSKGSAENVLQVMVSGKPTAKYFLWRVVEYEEGP